MLLIRHSNVPCRVEGRVERTLTITADYHRAFCHVFPFAHRLNKGYRTKYTCCFRSVRVVILQSAWNKLGYLDLVGLLACFEPEFEGCRHCVLVVGSIAHRYGVACLDGTGDGLNVGLCEDGVLQQVSLRCCQSL